MSSTPLFNADEVEALAKWRETNLTPATPDPAAPAPVASAAAANPFTQKQTLEGRLRGYRVRVSGHVHGDFGSRADAINEVRRQRLLAPDWPGTVHVVMRTADGIEGEGLVTLDPATAAKRE